MNDQNDWLEKNLDLLGRTIHLPDEPTAQQSARWTAPADRPRGGILRKGVSFMRRHIWISGGIGLAATVALASSFFLFGGQRVSAAMIFDQLRRTATESRIASIVYDHVAGEDQSFPYEMNLHAVIERDPAAKGPSVYSYFTMADGNVTFRMAEQGHHWNMKGSASEQILVKTPDKTWMFYHLTKVADDFYELNPGAKPLMPILKMAQSGLYVDNLGFHQGMDKSMRMVDMDVIAMSKPENFTNFVNDIQARAGQVDVSTLNDGTHLLKASDFGGRASEIFTAFAPNENAQDGILKPLFDQAVFEVAYREDNGVQRVRVTNLGTKKGEIRIAFDAQAEGYRDGLFDLAVHQKERSAPTMDFALIEKIFKMHGGHVHHADPDTQPEAGENKE